MNKSESAQRTAFLSRWALAWLVLSGLGVLLCSGCAGKGDSASGEVQPERSKAAAQQEAQAAAEQPAPQAKAEGPSRISLERVGNKTLVAIPVDEEVRVSPSYTYPKLKLSFTPGLSGSGFTLTPDDRLLSGVRPERDNGAADVTSLILELKQPVQFLISRPSSERVRVLLVPKQDQAETVQEPADAREGLNRLTDIDFTRNNEGTLFIKLFADSPIKYYTESGKQGTLSFVFPELDIPTAYAKLFRLHKFETPVEKALLENVSEGGRLRLSMDRRVPVNIDKSGNSLILAFQPLPGQKAEAASSRQQADAAEPAAQKGQAGLTDGSAQGPSTQAKGQAAQASLQESGQAPLFPGMKEEYTGQPISIDLQDAEIEHVLRLIAEVAGYNLILDENVSGTISLKLENVPWDQALDLVLLQKDLGMVKRGNILRIATADKLEKEHQRVIQARKAALEAQKSRQELAPLTTEYIQVNYTTAGQLQPQVQKFLSERGQVSQDARTNQLIVSDTPTHIDKVRSVVRKLDRPESQVLIEARIVFATDTFQRGLGLRWGGGYESVHQGGDMQGGMYGSQGGLAGGSSSASLTNTNVDESGYAINLPIDQAVQGIGLGLGGYISKLAGTDLFTIDAQLELGETKNQVKTISSPRIVTLNNQKAQVTQGRMLATKAESESGGTTTEYVEAVLDLSVTPQITPNNKLILDLDISDDSQAPGGGEDIETRTAKTKLMVDDGETVVLGGVQVVEETSLDQTNVPGLSDIPLLGWLFKNEFKDREKRELLIFIRPKIL